MTARSDSPFDALERIFHEPNRLAIMSVVCAARDGVPFTEIKATCDLTDGNLNRHLKVLEEAKAVSIRKRFVKSKPLTTVHLTKTGAQRFTQYLGALDQVLQRAQQAMPTGDARTATQLPQGRTAEI